MSAQAATFRFFDFSEDPDIVTLFVNGQAVTGNGTFSFGTISNFINQSFGFFGAGERMSFDYSFGTTSQASIVYTVLNAEPEDPRFISDEFLLYSGTDGVFHVDFVSENNLTGVMAGLHPGLTLPTPTILPELAQFQEVGRITIGGVLHDTFEVQSFVPEPASVALFGAGIIGLLVLRRCRWCRR